MRPTPILLAALVLAIAACGTGSTVEVSESSTSTSIDVPDESTNPVNTPPPKAPDIDLNAIPAWFQNEDAAPQGLVDAIAEELDATYVGSMSVNWSTSGLGCGSGGTELQVVTPGYVIMYQGNNSLVRVHAGENGRWLECGLGEPLRGTPVLNS